ncbi:TRAP transporter, DctM subunit [Oscillibacter sp. PC13]|uniref:TRAP transporter large permease n=1 Tax=Oscillibacter sp. PC13 TaxID=1855299 RepID=UPI0008EE31A6|nr:TRAP transporter large permease [Oscillibacter sp. PC13]SFP69318.1 TRAP transporter, DctM subunit [Oscillibacter sp. PC13]
MIIAVVFIFSLLIGVPIALVLGLSGIVHMVSMNPEMMTALPQKLFSSANNYSLLAIPLFLLAGELMGLSGDVDRLCNLARVLIGRVKGSLCYATVLLGAMLGASLGSANAEAALLGSVMYPNLVKDGYGETFSAGLIGATAVIGPMIPPGLLFVIYACQAGISVRDLFLCGVSVGIYLAIALFIVIFFFSRKRDWPVGSKPAKGEIWKAFRHAAFSLLSPAVALLCIATGICTATEAAAVLSTLIFLVGMFIYRTITVQNMYKCLLKSAVSAAAVLMIGAMGGVFGYTLAFDQIPTKIANFVIGLSDNKYVILLLINLMLLVVGMLMDATPAVIILVPVLMPIIAQYGFNPVHFGMIVCLNLTVGLLTPPVGTCLYTTASATGIEANKLVKSIWPWCTVCIVVLLFVTYVPQSVLWLPDLLASFA